MNNIKISASILILSSFVFGALPVSAATLYFNPSAGSVGPGSKMAVDILLDVEECVNAMEVDLSFPSDYLQLRDFIIGESILSLWVKQPNDNDIAEANKNGVLNFIGGVPGGYCGKIPGDTGDSNTVARLIFEVPGLLVADEQKSSLDLSFLSSTKVLLNDGFGTTDQLSSKSASFIYVNEKIDLSDNWSKELDADTIPPEPFVIELRRKADMFDNQYYIIFNTLDKQSGMDHYEVLEMSQEEEQGVITDLSWWEKLSGKERVSAEWKIALMPYLLIDQSLKSTIRVKAVDKAGNERFVEYIPSERNAQLEKKGHEKEIFVLVSLLVLLVIVIISIIIRKIIIKKRYDKEQNL